MKNKQKEKKKLEKNGKVRKQKEQIIVTTYIGSQHKIAHKCAGMDILYLKTRCDRPREGVLNGRLLLKLLFVKKHTYTHTQAG